MTKKECIIKACQVIRKRVRFDGASISLPTTPFPGNDTKAIREATRLYVESWIVPLLDSIESGDMTRIRQYYEFEKGHKMESPNVKVGGQSGRENMKNETPRSDAAEERTRLNYEMSRECGDPPYPGADMADFARGLERELNEVLAVFRHRHVNNGENDGCKKCGLDLRHEIHERVAAQPNGPDERPGANTPKL